MIPSPILAEIESRNRSSWSGTLALNFKDGQVIAYEVTEKHRIQQETHVSPAPRGQQHGSGR